MADFDQTPPDAGAPADAGTTPPVAPAAPATPEAPPEWPKKFLNEDGTENREAFLKGYHSLEHELATTKRVPNANQLQVPGASQAPEPLPENATATDHLQRMGLDENELAKQFHDKGHLTPKQYEAFAKNPTPKIFVDDYYKDKVKIAKYEIAAATADVMKFAGDKKQLQVLLDWATQNMPEDELPAMQARLRHPNTMLDAVKGIWADHQKAVGAGSAQPLITGDGAAPASTGGYTSQAEWLKANNDPRYETDKAYRATVDARADKTDVKIIHGFV